MGCCVFKDYPILIHAIFCSMSFLWLEYFGKYCDFITRIDDILFVQQVGPPRLFAPMISSRIKLDI